MRLGIINRFPRRGQSMFLLLNLRGTRDGTSTEILRSRLVRLGVIGDFLGSRLVW